MLGPDGEQLTPTFGFGSNSIRQLQGRLDAPDLVGYPARVPGLALAFAGPNRSWSHLGPAGGTATLIPRPGDVALGTLCYLSREQLQILDGCEGVPYVYDRRPVDAEVTIDGVCHQVQAVAYIKVNSTTWYAPTEAYCCAVLHNIRDSWPEVTQLTLRDCSGQEHGVFAHPGFEQLRLPALLFEVAVRRTEPGVLPGVIQQPVEDLAELGIVRGSDLRRRLEEDGLFGDGDSTPTATSIAGEDLAILRELLLPGEDGEEAGGPP